MVRPALEKRESQSYTEEREMMFEKSIIIISIVQEIWIESIVVPSVMRIILAFPMSSSHPPHGSSQTVGDVCPEHWSQEIEPGVNWTHKLVVWMGSKALVSQEIWESVLELVATMLHEAE